ncbi:RidA family protein [Psychromarinibacter halotolerans]|uniref:RidA family protein n=1 Tax=Psychromarinibacter halotolerans TaxID=1775175 RepID=A0ABV7GUU7_9RHOB|nr:RidA family protein [Psychromarinibacter halotolerans]MDF0596177.1 RidA family protein [Psychromarinibacter halotolerans]
MSPVKRVFSGTPYEARIGYCRAVLAGGFVHVAGTTGADLETGDMPDDVVAQCRNALDRIGSALAEVGARFEDAVRVRYILPNPDDFEPCWPLLRERFGDNPPVATMIVSGLLDPSMKIEIELMVLAPPDA